MGPEGADPFSLNTGVSLSPFQNAEESKTSSDELEKQQRQRNSLIPVAKDIMEFVSKEKDAIGDIRAYRKSLGAKPKAGEFEKEYRARELYMEFLERFEQWMILRLQKVPSQPTRKPVKR